MNRGQHDFSPIVLPADFDVVRDFNGFLSELNRKLQAMNKLLPVVAFGQIRVQDNPDSQTLTLEDTLYPWTTNWVEPTVFNMAYNLASGELRITLPGYYIVGFSVCSFSGTASQTYEIAVMINGAGAESLPHTYRVIGTGGDVGTAPGFGLDPVRLELGDVVSLGVECTSAAGKAVTMQECNLFAWRLIE